MAVHHRRRLRSLGHAARSTRRDDGRCGPPATRRRAAGNALEVLVDGAQALPEIERRSAARAATSTSPAGRSRRTSPSTRDEPPVVLRELLAEHGRARRRPRADVGGRAAAARSPPTAPRCATRATSSTRGTKVRARCDARSRADALPPREARDRRRRGRVRRRHRPDARSAATAATRRPPGARPARLARRGVAPARPGGRRRRGALRRPLGRGHRRAASPRRAAPPAPAGDAEVQVVRTVPERQYDFVRDGDFRILEAYVRARCAPRGGSSTSRASSSGRPRSSTCSRPSCATRRPTTSASSSSCPRERTTAQEDTRGQLGRPRRRRHGGGRFLAATIASRTGRDDRPPLRPRQDRDRRRPLADDRLGEPQRALALQRQRDERRHLRPGARARHAARGCGPSTSSATPPRSRATRPPSSTTLWRPTAFEQLARAAARRPRRTGSSRCRRRRGGWTACSRRSTRSSSTAEPARRPSPTPRPRRARAARRGRRSGATSRCSSSSAARPGGRPCG